MLHSPLHSPLDTIAQADQRLVAEAPLRLGDVVVPRHGAVHDPLAVEGRRLPQDPEGDLAQEPQEQARVPAQDPDLVGGPLRAGLAPDGAHEVPEVDGAAVGDEEGLAVDLLVVEGRGGRGVGHEQGAGREEVRVRYVLDVREVEQVRVRADLHLVLPLAVDVDGVVD